MQGFLRLRAKYKIIAGVIALLLCIAGLIVYINAKTQVGSLIIPHGGENDFAIDIRSTNFAEIGTLVFDNPTYGQNPPYLVYEKPGMPAITKAIVMDVLSVCATETGALPCVAMSVTFDVPFGGKRAFVEGIEQDDGTILLRKLQVVPDDFGRVGNEPTGDIFISWPHAVSLIQSCAVSEIFQSHSLDVYLTLKENDMRVRAIEPGIDEVFRISDATRDSCPSVPVATE